MKFKSNKSLVTLCCLLLVLLVASLVLAGCADDVDARPATTPPPLPRATTPAAKVSIIFV